MNAPQSSTAPKPTRPRVLHPQITYSEVDAIHVRVAAQNIVVRKIDDTNYALMLGNATIVYLDHVGVRELEDQLREVNR